MNFVDKNNFGVDYKPVCTFSVAETLNFNFMVNPI